MSEAREEPTLSSIAIELPAATRLIRELWLELRMTEERLYRVRGSLARGEATPLEPVAMLIRAIADRLADRAMALHAIARKIEEIARFPRRKSE